MKYAIISDIHGNYPALSAVLADAKKTKVDKFIFVGDYGMGLHFPNEVINTIRYIDNAYVVRGNHEDYMDNLSKQDQSTWTDGQSSSFYWCYKILSNENRDYISKLPKEIELNLNESHVRVFHSYLNFFNNATMNRLTSRDYTLCYPNKLIAFEEYKQNLKEQMKLDYFLYKTLNNLTDDIYIFGHSHIQWNIEIYNKILINPGSCGIPLDGNTSAPYTIIEKINGVWHIKEKRVSYDLDLTINEFLNSELFEQSRVMSNLLIKQLRTGQEYLSFFFEFTNNYANKINDTTRPYSHEVWNKSYEMWQAK